MIYHLAIWMEHQTTHTIIRILNKDHSHSVLLMSPDGGGVWPLEAGNRFDGGAPVSGSSWRKWKLLWPKVVVTSNFCYKDHIVPKKRCWFSWCRNMDNAVMIVMPLYGLIKCNDSYAVIRIASYLKLWWHLKPQHRSFLGLKMWLSAYREMDHYT